MNRRTLPVPRGAWLAPLLFALLAPPFAAAQALVPGSPALPLEARERLSLAADDARLAPWQRDLMRGLADPDRAASEVGDEDARPTLAARTTDAVNGTWGEMIIDSRWSHSAIYDPVRDCLVVFGGVDSSNRYLDDLWVVSLAGTPNWIRLSQTGTPPTARSGAAMVYDPKRDRVVIFGGRVAASPFVVGDVWTLSLAGAATWTQLSPAGTPAPALYEHTAIYDPVHDRMVVFGGHQSSLPYRNDVWALSFAGTPTWSQLTPTGTPPVGRALHEAVYDPVRARMLVYGGLSATATLNDVWALSLSAPAWSPLSPTGSPPNGKTGTSAAYDRLRDRLLVFAGQGSGTPNLNVWALTLAGTPNWTAIGTSGPAPSLRFEQTAIYDPVRDRLVAFGGQTEPGGARNDLWALTLAGTPTWTELTPNGRPPEGRHFHSAIVDSARGRMLVFAGATNNGARRNDLWALSLAGVPVWSAPVVSGTPPMARYGHSAILDPVRDRMVVFGGYTQAPANSWANDVWSLSLSEPMTWTQLAPLGTPPTPRSYHTAIYDPVRDRMLVFGGTGFDGVFSGTYNDVWALSLGPSPAWTQVAPAGGPVPTRHGHTAIYDAPRDRMLVFGGEHSTRFNDTWALSLAGAPTWTLLAPSGTAPSARSEAGAIFDPLRDRMVICGGLPSGATADAWALSLAGAPAWSLLSPAEEPPPSLSTHSAVYDAPHDRMVVFGGQPYRNGVWGLTWTSPVGVQEPPRNASAAYLRAPAPNPTRGATTVAYSIARPGRVRLAVHDLGGRLVRTLIDAERATGPGSARWDGTDAHGARLAPGVYLVTLNGPDVRLTRRVVVLR